ncbi:YheC/YheD family endospore coat-associated protein [Thermincola ferriacetica]
MLFLEIKTISTETADKAYLTEEGFKALDCTESELFTIKAGCNEVKVNLYRLNQSTNSIVGPRVQLYLPKITCKYLNLPESLALSALVDRPKKTIKIGPFLGYLITRNKRLRIPPFTTQRPMLQLFSKIAREYGVISFAFAPQDIDWPNRKINGYIATPLPDGNVLWRKDTFPFPDVVYNRVLNRSSERKDLINETVKNLQKVPGLHHFNPRFLNKWETHTILSRNPEMAKYLPQTTLLRNFSDINEFLDKYGKVYIKPINGSLGANIIKLEKVLSGFQFQYRRKRKNQSGIWPDRPALQTELTKLLGRRLYVVQQGLDLLTYQGRVFDIRVLLQKNGSGRWTTAATVARVASENNIFPNIAAGGTALPIEKVWESFTFGDWETSEVRQKLLDLSSNVHKTLEEELGNFAELGLDVGISKTGHVWLIEVNSKPSRKVFPKNQPHLKVQSIINIIDYARYLSGFPNPQNNTGDYYESNLYTN